MPPVASAGIAKRKQVWVNGAAPAPSPHKTKRAFDAFINEDQKELASITCKLLPIGFAPEVRASERGRTGLACQRSPEHPHIGNTHFSGHTMCFNFFCQTPLRMPPDAPGVVGHCHKNDKQIHQKCVKKKIFLKQRYFCANKTFYERKTKTHNQNFISEFYFPPKTAYLTFKTLLN